MNITIENLRHFEVLANLQNINKTAVQLSISPSAISLSLSKIESELEKKLFNRVGKRIFLNSSGRDFLDKTKTILEQFSSLKSYKNNQEGFKGHIKIGASHWLASKILSRACMNIHQDHKELNCEIKSMDTFRLTNELLTGQIDFALSFNIDGHPEITQDVIYKSQLKIVVFKKHPMAKLNFENWQKQINNFSHIAHKSGKLMERCEDHPMFSKFDIKPKISHFWDSDEVGLELLRNSQAWTLIPDIVIKNSKEFVALDSPIGWESPYTVSLLYLKGSNKLDLIKNIEIKIKKLLELDVL